MMKLSINMRLCQINDAHENQRQKSFADLLLQIGDSKYPVIPKVACQNLSGPTRNAKTLI
jgi:hypothetical protein